MKALLLARSQGNRPSKMSCSMRGELIPSTWLAFVVGISRFIHVTEYDVSILFATLSSLDLVVWVFTQGKMLEVGFTLSGLVGITIAITCFNTCAFFLSTAPGFKQFWL